MAIDAVFTWVDGDEPAFRTSREALADFTPPAPLEKWRRKSQYTGVNEARENPTVSAAQTEGRFRNMDELRYALRALEQNAPWIGNVFILTNGQVPDWIDTAHPRLRIVTHAQVFADADCLPTFNSNAIELQMHRIPGLSEEFIYFNDDFFLGRPVTPDDFRLPDGRHCLFVEPGRGLPLQMVDRALAGHMWAYNHNLIEARFGKKPGRLQFAHTPQLYSRSLLIEMQALWREECALTVRHRFRTPFDVALRILYTAYVAEGGLAALMEGKGAAETPVAAMGVTVPLSDVDYVFVKLGDDRTPYMDDIALVLHRRPKFFCVNDEIRSGDAGRDAALKAMFGQFLEVCFPQPSAFEKPGTDKTGLNKTGLDRSGMNGAAMNGAGMNGAGMNGADPAHAPFAPPRRVLVQEIEPQAAALEYRETPQAAWKPCTRQPLPAGADLRGAGGAAVTARLHLRIETDDDARHPERGFPPDRLRIWTLTLAAGKTAALRDFLAGYHRDLALSERLEATAAPALDHPSGSAMGQFLWADRLIRAGRAPGRAEAVGMALERALLGGVEGGWVCHRLVLLALQCGAPDQARRHAMAVADCSRESGIALIDLAQRLAASGQKTEALAVAGGVAADPRHRAAALELRCRLLGPDGVSPDDLGALITAPVPSVEDILLWSRIALHRAPGPGETGDALVAAVSALITRLLPGTEKGTGALLTQARLARFRLLSRQGARVLAALDLRAVLARNPAADDLIAMAAEEAHLGHPEGEASLLEGLRMACPWLQQVDLAWAMMKLRRGQITPEVEAVLARAMARAEAAEADAAGPDAAAGAGADGPDLATRLLLIRACASLGRREDMGRMVGRLAREPGRLPDLLQLSRRMAQDGLAEPALDLLDQLCRIWPQNGELQLNRADQAISLGQKDAGVVAALAAAEQGGADPFWVGYHRLRVMRLAGQEAGVTALVAGMVQTDGHVETLLRLGRDWREGGHAPLSLRLHDGLRSVRPGHGPTAMAWADLALGLGETGDDIEAALDGALQGGGDVYWTRYHRLRLFLAQSRAERARTEAAMAECGAIAALGGRPDPFAYLIDQATHLDPEDREALRVALHAQGVPA